MTELQALVAALEGHGVYAAFGPELRKVMEEGFQKTKEGLNDTLFLVLRTAAIRSISADLSPVAYEKAVKLATDQARRQARTLATNLFDTELEKLGQLIADGLEHGWGPREIARRMDVVKGLDAQRVAQYERLREYLESLDLPDAQVERRLDREFQKLLRDRREVIAATEARFATAAAREAEAKARGNRWKASITVGDSRVSDICAANEAAGVIGIDEEFPSGHRMPPFHPRCRCTLAYGTSDSQKTGMERRANERTAATAKARGAYPEEE
ncbi:MAG: hypothetical protein GHCLOJNM_03078 [bacterium]|nr:hypothetical protein [bacterium]